jgi:hypothetical protein
MFGRAKMLSAVRLPCRTFLFGCARWVPQSKRTIRIFLSARGLNQDEDSADQPSWICRIEGRLIEEKDVCG